MSKKALSNLTAVELQLCIKNKLGMAHLCEKYDCSEDQLVGRVKRLYKKTPKKSTRIMRGLRENDEQIANQAMRAEVATESSEPENTDSGIETGATAPVVELVETKPKELSKEELVEREKILSDEVAALELRHLDVEDAHRANLNSKRKVLDAVRSLEDQLTELGQEYEDLCLESADQETEMKKLSEEKREKADELDALRAQIRNVMRVVVFVYNDESISAPDTELTLDDSGYEKVKSSLIQRSECRRLAIWEIELLARTIRVMVHLERDGKEVEFVFENSTVEQAYMSLLSIYQTAKQQTGELPTSA